MSISPAISFWSARAWAGSRSQVWRSGKCMGAPPSDRHGLARERPDLPGRVLRLLPRDIQVRAGADDLGPERGDEHPLGAEPVGDLRGCGELGVDLDPDE